MRSKFVDELIEKYAGDPLQREILAVHSEMVAQKALRIAAEKGLESAVDMQFLEDAAMLHDIGIVGVNAPAIHCNGTMPYIAHGIIGAQILKSEGLPEEFSRVCERHTGSGISAEDVRREGLPLPERDFLPDTIEERLICYADKFFSKSRDLRKEKTFEEIERSMSRFGEDALERFRKLKAEFG